MKRTTKRIVALAAAITVVGATGFLASNADKYLKATDELTDASVVQEQEVAPEAQAEEAKVDTPAAEPAKEAVADVQKEEIQVDKQKSEGNKKVSDGKSESAAQVDRSVKIECAYEDGAELKEGTKVTLKAKLKGYSNVDYSLQWQRSKDGKNWEDIPNATGEKYELTLTEDNDEFTWRVAVIVPAD